MIKVSYIIAVLDSHEVVRRQLLYWKKLDLPDDIEIILVDDGSDPPLEFPDNGVRNLTIFATHDRRPWTYALARNQGTRLARGEYVLHTDIDHIVPLETLMLAREFCAERMIFHRQFAVLDPDGNLTQDVAVLRSYGLLPEWIEVKALRAPIHWDSYLMRRDLFWRAGGYDEKDAFKHPPMGETHFRAAYRALGLPTSELHPLIYIIPNGQFCGDLDHNPFGMFHGLTRKSRHNARLQREVESKRKATV